MIGRHRSVGAKVVGLILGLALLVGFGAIIPTAWAQTVIPLTNGVPVNSSIAQDFFRDFSIVVPSGATQLTVTTTNATGDVDLYVRRDPGDHILPDDDHFDCRPLLFSGNETCPDPNEPGNIALFANPQPGTWFVSVFGFDPGTHSFTVTATFQVSGGGGGILSDFVTRLYQTVLGREPDQGGLQAFVEQIQDFGTVIPTVLAFFKSPEFLQKQLNDVQFLTVLYRTFLNREPDPPGLAAFLALLQSGCMTPDTLIAALSFSQEFQDSIPLFQVSDPRIPFLAEIFAWTLNRPPDPGGFASFLAQLQRSTAFSTIINFLHSQEFRNPRKSPVEYVSSLYLVFLGRPPDCGGLASFVAALNPDTDAKRDQLAAQFGGSQEFDDILDEVFGSGPPPPPPPPPPPGGGISGTYATTGTLTASIACGAGTTPITVTSFNFTINQTGSTFTASGAINTVIEQIPIQVTINANGTVNATNQLSGQFTLHITINVQGFPPIDINGNFTGSVTGNTLTLNGSGTLSPIPGVDIPPGCTFNVSLTGTR